MAIIHHLKFKWVFRYWRGNQCNLYRYQSYCYNVLPSGSNQWGLYSSYGNKCGNNKCGNIDACGTKHNLWSEWYTNVCNQFCNCAIDLDQYGRGCNWGV